LYRKYFKTDHPGENQSNPSISRTKGPIIIKNDVWIGDDVKIMSGVTIGNGACIAAGSIVTNDISDFEIVGGVPARLLKYRFSDEIMSFLKAIEWWDWSDKKIKNNKHFFNLNLNEPIDIKNFKINT
jgi:acetyltransferase-like isoleucine patch superfamily enzyme